MRKPLSLNKILKILWLGILSAGILSNPSASYPGRDSGIFLYIGSLILKGKLPYVDAWENKGPLVFYINALGIWLAGGSRWGIWLLEFLWFCISGYVSYLALKKIMGEVPALVGTSVFIVAAGNVLQGGNFSEEYSLLFSCIAILFFLKDVENFNTKDTKEKSAHPLWINGFIIGATLGLNILLRPNNIGIQVAIAGAYFILAILSKDWRLLVNRAIQIVTGALVVIVPVLFYFSAKGALTEMLNVVIMFNAQYSSGGGALRFIEGIINASNGVGLIWIGVAGVGYVLALISVFKRETRAAPLGSFLLVLLIGLPVEALLSTVSGKNYPHYFIGWSLYMGLLAGFVTYLLLVIFTTLTEEKAWAKTDNFSIPLVVLLIVIAIATNLDTWKNYGTVLAQIGKPGAQFDYRDPIVDYVQKNAAPEDKILIWGFRPIINFITQRESPATYLPYPLSHVDTPLARHWADDFYEQLAANPPALIVNMIEDADRERIPDLDPEVRKRYKIKWKDVVLAHNYKETLEFIRQHYTRVDNINGYDIYRLNTGK